MSAFKSLYIDNIPSHITDETLLQIFGSVVKVWRVDICYDFQNSKRLTYGYIRYFNAADG